MQLPLIIALICLEEWILAINKKFLNRVLFVSCSEMISMCLLVFVFGFVVGVNASKFP